MSFKSSDETEMSISAYETEAFNKKSIFSSLQDASSFFKNGEYGYSPKGNKFEGLRLKAYNWQVTPLNVVMVKSSFFENEEIFPKGSVTFDNALLMTGIEHEWISLPEKQ